jgi:hypothetical protein
MKVRWMIPKVIGAMIVAGSLLRLSTAEGAVVNPCAADLSGATFAKAVKVLKGNYSPAPSRAGAGFGTPPIDGTKSPSSSELKDLQRAFQIAPPLFQQMLCSLDGVYLDPTADNSSWGFRDPRSFKEYIGLSIPVLWPDSSAPAVDLRTYETRRIRQIFLPNVSGYGPYYGPALPDNTSQMTVLAALAHEAGHIFWYDVNRPGGSYTYGFCNKHFLDSWANSTSPASWIRLGYLNSAENEHNDNSSSDNVKVSDIQNAINQNNPAVQEQMVKTVLQSLYSKKGRWASGLAAFTPTEDLVETFQYVVLKNSDSGFTSFPLFFQGSDGSLTPIGDILSDGDSKQNFIAKKACFRAF